VEAGSQSPRSGTLEEQTYPAGEIAAPTENRHARGSRAAQAAARVAARYANAPSYSEMLTREARAAVHAAEAASKAAQQAQAAFQYVLDGLEAATSAEPEWEPEPISKRHAGPVAVAPPQKLAERPQVHHEAAMRQGGSWKPTRNRMRRILSRLASLRSSVHYGGTSG